MPNRRLCLLSSEITFRAGETEHFVEVRILYDGEREMREAFSVHLRPDEHMVAETRVSPGLLIKT